MPIDDTDLKRLRELPRTLMLLADALDARLGSISNEGQQDLRWLSKQLPKILEERKQVELDLQEAKLNQKHIVGHLKESTGQLAQAKEKVERLSQALTRASLHGTDWSTKICCFCSKETDNPFSIDETVDESPHESDCWILTLNPEEAKDAND